MNERTATVLCILALGLLAIAFAASFAVADPYAPSSLGVQSSTKRNLSTQSTQSLNAIGGNVTEVNINALTLTKTWQGYYGNLTGVVTLQDGRNFTFYNWTAASLAGRVFATRNASIQWDSVNCSNSTTLANEESYLGKATTDADSVTNTFTRKVHPQFTVSTQTIYTDTCNSTNGYMNNNSQTINFTMVLLTDVYQNIIYSTILNSTAARGFDSNLHNFELLVGVNSSIATTPYYFWVEFD